MSRRNNIRIEEAFFFLFPIYELDDVSFPLFFSKKINNKKNNRPRRLLALHWRLDIP